MSESAVSIRFGADVTGLDAAVAVAKAQLTAFNAEVRKLAKEAATSGGVVNDNLAKALREASAGAAGMQKELRSLTAKPIVEVEDAAKRFNKQLDNIATFAWNNTSLSGNEIERVVNPLKGLTNTIGVVPTVALAASAAIAALAAVTGNYAQEELAKLGDVVKQTGVSANSIQGAKGVGAGVGVGSDAMVEAIKNASKEFQQFSRNSGEVKDNLEKVDEAFLKVADKAKTSGEFIDIVGQKIRALPREEGIDLAKALFGDDTGEKLYEPIIRGQLEMQKLGQAAQTAGAALDDGVVKAAREAQIQIDEAEAKTSGKLLHAFQSLAAPVAAVKIEFHQLVGEIADAIAGITTFLARMRQGQQDGVAAGAAIAALSKAAANGVKLGEWQGPREQAKLPDLDIGSNAGASRARYEARDKDDDKKSKKTKSPKGDTDALAAARAETEGEIQAVQQQTQINIAQYELDAASKKISEEEKKRLVQQAADQEFASIKALYEREAAIAGEKPQQRQVINNKIEALESQHQVKMLELATKEIQDAAQLAHDQAQQMAGTLTSSLSQALIGAVEHTKTKDAGRKIAQSLFSDLVNEFAKNSLTDPLEKALEPAFKNIGDLITQPLQDAIKKALGGITSGISGALGSGAGGAISGAAAGAAGSAGASGAGAVALSTAGVGLSSSAAELTAAAAALSSAAAAIGAGSAAAGAGGAAASGGGFFSRTHELPAGLRHRNELCPARHPGLYPSRRAHHPRG